MWFDDHYAPSFPNWRGRHKLGHLKGQEAAYTFLRRIPQRCPERSDRGLILQHVPQVPFGMIQNCERPMRDQEKQRIFPQLKMGPADDNSVAWERIDCAYWFSSCIVFAFRSIHGACGTSVQFGRGGQVKSPHEEKI
jgi:hypothetical protein